MNSRFGGGWLDAKRTGVSGGGNGINRCAQGANRDICLVSNRYVSLVRGQDWSWEEMGDKFLKVELGHTRWGSEAKSKTLNFIFGSHRQ